MKTEENADRYNAGKPQLTYLLDFQDALSCLGQGIISLAEYDGGYDIEDVLRSLQTFLNTRGECEIGELYTAAAVLTAIIQDGELRYFDKDWNEHGLLETAFLQTYATHELVKVCEKGAVKYDRGNWQKGLKVYGVLDSTCRHIEHYITGQTHDEESGCLNLAHALWNVLAVLYYLHYMPELDDRIHYETK